MNLRHVRNRIFTSMVALGFVCAILAMGARPASAQSITVTTPFPFCVNNQVFPRGTYRFTPQSQWLLSIRNVSGGPEELFPVRPGDRERQGSVTGPMGKVGGVIFRNSGGVQMLNAVYDPVLDLSLEFPGHHSPNQHNCTAKDYTLRSYNSAGK